MHVSEALPNVEVRCCSLQNTISLTLNRDCKTEWGIVGSGRGSLQSSGGIWIYGRRIWGWRGFAILLDGEVFEEQRPFIFAM